MSDDTLRPLPDDPDGDQIVAMFDLGNDEWLLTGRGDYQTAAGETMTNDGDHWQRVVMLEWPVRVNHTDERRVVRLMIDPADAIGLADVLRHTAHYLMRRPS